MDIQKIEKLDVENKRILLRLELNVPMNGTKIEDITRIEQALPTVEFLLKKNAKIIIITHIGRPDGKVVEELRVDSVAEAMSKLLKRPIKKMDSAIGDDVKKEIDKMKSGEIIMLENIRFYPEEKDCTPEFCKKLASYADYFVMDAFGTAHRAHASTYGVTEYMPGYAGILLTKEVHALSPLLEHPRRPVTLVLGGSKIDTKIGVIKNFIQKADHLLIGGGLANTFLYAQGFNVGESLFEKDKADIAREIMLECEKYHDKFHLPQDAIVADRADSDTVLNVPVSDVEGNMKIFDIGEKTAERYARIIKNSQTIFWNGPVGLYEKENFRNGSRLIAQAIAESNATTIVGGGDTIDCVAKCGFDKGDFTHISTGGGASLEFLSGEILPGIKPLIKGA